MRVLERQHHYRWTWVSGYVVSKYLADTNAQQAMYGQASERQPLPEGSNLCFQLVLLLQTQEFVVSLDLAL